MMTLGLTGTTKNEAKPKMETNPIVENKAAAEEKPKSKRKWLVIGAATMVVAVACAAFFVFPNHLGFGKAFASRHQNKPKGIEPVKAVFTLDPFLVNLADVDEVRFLKATFQLGLAEEPPEEAKNAVAIAAIRDSILSLLSAKTADQILKTPGKEKLREEIRARVNSISPRLNVLEVYIVDFVIQL